jgi:heterodisulfide reductase subunit C2
MTQLGRMTPDTDFVDQLRRLAGDDFLRCYQCGACINSCPVGIIRSDFNPRIIMRMAVLGLREELLAAEDIWRCSRCYTCQERCPQQSGICDLIFALRNLAVASRGLLSAHRKMIGLLEQQGRLYELDEFTRDDREMAGLPQLPEDKEDVGMLIGASLLAKD